MDPRHAAAALPLRWWTDAQLAQVALALEKALRAWEQDWGLQQPHSAQDAVRCAVASDDPGREDGTWKPVALNDVSEPACELWWDLAAPAVRADPVLLLVDALFGSAAEAAAVSHASVGEIAAEAARGAWADLWRRIGQALAIGVSLSAPAMQADALRTLQPPEPLLRAWSGAICITLHWCGQHMRILMGGREAARLIERTVDAAPVRHGPPMVPVWHAVADLATSVRAELAPVELTLGAIKELRVGDIIELAHPLERPVIAKAAGGETLCEAFLGRQGGQRAIELLTRPVRA